MPKWLLFLAQVLLLFLCGKQATGHEHAGHLKGFLFDNDRNTFSIPLDINIGLIGFNGDGADKVQVDASDFQLSLQNSMEACKPVCLETKDELNVQYDITYKVLHFSTDAVRKVEELIATHTEFVGYGEESDRLYDAEITSFEQDLDEMYEREFQKINLGTDKTQSREEGGPDVVDRAPYTILLINPNKDNIRKTIADIEASHTADRSSALFDESTRFQYRYRYENGAQTQVWIGEHRYIAVDITAGPCEYGVTDAGEGTVSAGTIPRLETEPSPKSLAYTNPTLRFSAQLSSLVISSLQHVFVSDLRYESVKFAEKLIIPIIVLRNHDRFNPVEDSTFANPRQDVISSSSTTRSNILRHHANGAPISKGNGKADSLFKIDTEQINTQIRKLLLPHQELKLETTVSSIYDHHLVSNAVFKALRGDTVHTASASGRYVAKTIPYIDSSVLLDELEGAVLSELLAQFVQEASASELLTTGSRIVPVIVLSLLGLPENVLFDHIHSHIASTNAVLVLQTGEGHITLPYFSEQGIIHLNARNPTRHIIAGISQALGGLTNPYENYSTLKKVLVSDYTWANGNHPFGPFSNSSRVSQIFADTILRNAILSRVTTALANVRYAVKEIQYFYEEFVSDYRGTMIEYQDSRNLLSRMWSDHGKDLNTVLASDVVSNLYREIESLEEQFTALAVDIRFYRLNAASTLSATVLELSRAFRMYVDDELESARTSLECCRQEYHMVDSHYSNRSFLMQLAFIVIIGVCVFLFVKNRAVGTSKLDTSNFRTRYNQNYYY